VGPRRGLPSVRLGRGGVSESWIARTTVRSAKEFSIIPNGTSTRHWPGRWQGYRPIPDFDPM
jgi:hypothetical protein